MRELNRWERKIRLYSNDDKIYHCSTTISSDNERWPLVSTADTMYEATNYARHLDIGPHRNVQWKHLKKHRWWPDVLSSVEKCRALQPLPNFFMHTTWTSVVFSSFIANFRCRWKEHKSQQKPTTCECSLGHSRRHWKSSWANVFVERLKDYNMTGGVLYNCKSTNFTGFWRSRFRYTRS